MAAIRDALWLWGTRPNALQGYGFPTSRMTVAQALSELGLDQVMMCGLLPPGEDEYLPVHRCRRILWEMSFEDGFGFEAPLQPIARLHRSHPNVAGVLLDDFSTTEIKKGAKPELLARMRRYMPDSLGLWLVIYSMSLDIPNLDRYLRHADGVSFWVWDPRDLEDLPEYVSRCNELSAGKPMILGLYLYDFSCNRPLSLENMERQVLAGVELLRKGECVGLCFLGSSVLDIGLETVDWTKRWVKAHGGDRL